MKLFFWYPVNEVTRCGTIKNKLRLRVRLKSFLAPRNFIWSLLLRKGWNMITAMTLTCELICKSISIEFKFEKINTIYQRQNQQIGVSYHQRRFFPSPPQRFKSILCGYKFFKPQQTKARSPLSIRCREQTRHFIVQLRRRILLFAYLIINR